jgi:predicted metal-dependent enzyme (double-stranded beta helix superfamily)
MYENLQKSIQTVIDKLQGNLSINNSVLAEIIHSSNVTESDLKEFSEFNHNQNDSYGRRQIYKTENFGIYVMSWCKGDFTAIHSHGHSEWGAVYFLGDADHRTYFANGNELKLMSSEIIKTGSIAAVCGDLVHAMGNLSDNPFLTLHIYGSNSYKGTITEDSKVYELNKNRIRTTLGPAFLNIADDLCKADENGIITDDKTLEDFENFTKLFFDRQ